MLLQFNRFAIMTGIASLVIVAVYPFMKRITWWPQVVLGLAFSWGALMGFAVTLGRIDLTALALYAGSIAWVIGYDTIYAHQDAEDDALIGVKSTARLFGARTHRALALFYSLAVVLIGAALALAGARWPAWIGLAAFAAHLVWQIKRLDISDPALCLRVFKSNRDAGLLLFAGLLVDAVMRCDFVGWAKARQRRAHHPSSSKLRNDGHAALFTLRICARSFVARMSEAISGTAPTSSRMSLALMRATISSTLCELTCLARKRKFVQQPSGGGVPRSVNHETSLLKQNLKIKIN